MTTPETATSKETPKDSSPRKAMTFEERMMSLPPDAGRRRESTWQSHYRGNRFNAHGCGG
jgi:hypothetical protein